MQQGDPLGPLLFCLSIHQLSTQLSSHFKMFYLDDGSLGGTVNDVLHNLSIFEEIFRQLGLPLNRAKSEVICPDPGTLVKFCLCLLGFKESNSVRFPLSNNVDESILDKLRLL